MSLVADLMLILGALGLAAYCFVLSRRLMRFTDLERGVGGAIAVLSAQVDDLDRSLERARAASEASGAALGELTERADSVARRLELHLAALQDLPPTPDLAPDPDPAPIAEPAPEPEPSPAPETATKPARPDGATRATPSFFTSQRSPEAV